MASKKPKTVSHSALLPGGQWMARAGTVLLILMALTLFVMSRSGNPALMALRTQLADAMTPVLTVAASPINAVRGAGQWAGEMASLREENIRLRNENLRLLHWQEAAREMETENQALRDLLAVVPQQKRSYITARMVSDVGGPYAHAALINGGAHAGIKPDQAVINEDGLIGRVIESGQNSARVLLLTDINSRVPVIAEQTREKSILAGASGELPELSYLAAGSKIAVGERIITSGDGGVFPPGIPVGVVAGIDNGAVRVRPFADPTQTTFVSAVDYTF